MVTTIYFAADGFLFPDARENLAGGVDLIE